jgi:hypothetical protein
MSGDAHVQFWEGLGVRFPGVTQLNHTCVIRGQMLNLDFLTNGRETARYLHSDPGPPG